jgi:hypothetical protein
VKRYVTLFILSTILLSATQRTPAPSTATQKAVAAARAFLGTLDTRQRAIVKVDLNKTTRSKWSNLPSAPGFTSLRNGIRMAELNASQQRAALALVAATLSDSGYQKVLNIVKAEEIRTGSLGQQSAEYQIAILGEPSTTEPWMIQFGGHHLAINITVVGAQNVLTPSHTGTEPATFSLNGRMIRPLGNENDKGFALINALNPEQRRQAILNYQVADTVFGPGRDEEVIQPEGVRAANLNATQQAMLVDLIKEWVSILNDASASAKMAEIQSNLANTYFAWSGPTTNGSPAYFRIQGPAVQIEYAPQDGTTDHIHTYYRDPINDYGAKLIKP